MLVPGNPRLGVSWIDDLEKSKHDGLIQLRIVDGISSFDTMITDLGRDPLEKGTVIIDANRLLLYQLKLEPRMDYFIYHVCSVGTTKTNYSNPSLDNRIDLLKNCLLKSFPPNHEAILVQSGMVPGKGKILTTCSINELENITSKITFSSSLFIPGLQRSTKDNEFSALLRE